MSPRRSQRNQPFTKDTTYRPSRSTSPSYSYSPNRFAVLEDDFDRFECGEILAQAPFAGVGRFVIGRLQYNTALRKTGIAFWEECIAQFEELLESFDEIINMIP